MLLSATILGVGWAWLGGSSPLAITGVIWGLRGRGTRKMAPAHGWQLALSADLLRLLTWVLHVPSPRDVAAGF